MFKKLVLIFIFFILSCNKQETEQIPIFTLFGDKPKSPNVLPEWYSGGSMTLWDSTINAFDLAGPIVLGDSLLNFVNGNAIFNITWVAPGNSAINGLGPTFNARSCRACHVRDGRGRPPTNSNTVMTEMLVRVSLPNQKDSITGGPVPLPNYGDQINEKGIVRVQGNIPGEAFITVSYTEIPGKFPDGETYTLKKPIYTFSNWNFGNPGVPGRDFLYSPRTAQHMSGMGLLEAIPEKTIRSLADPDDEDKDGISGRVNIVWDVETKTKKMGRFGWKANQPNLRQQVLGAFSGDVGLTSDLFPNQDCPGIQTACKTVPKGDNKNTSGHELSIQEGKNLEAYVALLNVPGRRNFRNKEVIRGQELFNSIGCVKCHVSELKTGKLNQDTKHKELADQTIRPYTDLLLHDMGEDLADNRPDFEATGREWRTPPLWGIGLFDKINSHTQLLHDGRAGANCIKDKNDPEKCRNAGYMEAILWHGGEASSSKNAYKSLVKSDRQALLEFLKSL